MEVKVSTCIITNGNYCVYARQDVPVDEFETTPHAPIQALILARKEDIEGGTAYVSRFPCYVCAKALAAAGIHHLVYKEENDFAQADTDKAMKIFEINNIEVVKNKKMEVEG